MIKTNIKMRVTPEQSETVQKICFANGIYWRDSGEKILRTSIITISRNGVMTLDWSDKDEEVNTELFIRTNGTCEIPQSEEEYLTQVREYINNGGTPLQKTAAKMAGIEKEINEPEHYKVGGIETIDYLKAKLSKEEYMGFLLGNMLKYMSRCKYKKDQLKDLKKAQWYLNKAIEEIENV